ncbi:fatty acid oxidation complex subunit alpha FadB [Morganella psychrotolerans]|uniref:fatty acid oxidation complex subunit alpha FadB n=1 Tax=Morganella psychrotolerans TaxID=368603 RepID=UPI0039AF6D30
MLYHSESIKISWEKEGIAKLVFDAQDAINKLDTRTIASLNDAVACLEKTERLKGLIVTSSKESFILGADITEFIALFDATEEQLATWLNFANQLFNRLEDLPIPTVSALRKFTLGGGCECALTTDYRLATEDLRIGLPETKLGIMPGFGGSVRLPRLIGCDNALELITQGKIVTASEALKLGLIDGIVPDTELIGSALTLLEQAISGSLNWNVRRLQKISPLQLSPTEQQMSFIPAKGLIRQKAGKHYPAPMAAVNAIEAGAGMSRDGALTCEAAHFIPLTKTLSARALVSLFLNEQYVKGITRRLVTRHDAPKQAAVIGAGIMGGGIAYQSACNGIPAILKDIQPAALRAGVDEATKLLEKQCQQGKLTLPQAATIRAAIRPVLQYDGINECDIVVEAVIENISVKQQVLAEVERQVSTDCILTSNTSSIPINKLAQVLKRPENFCGMHFFNPVPKMMLVEVIRGEKTSDSTIAAVVHYAHKMGKTPVVVGDCPGFFINRVLFPYLNAFSRLVSDGADIQIVDQIMEQEFGWPMGPALLLDVVGLDTASHAQKVMAEGYPDRMTVSSPDVISLLADLKRLGQKNHLGFYRHIDDAKGRLQKQPDEQLGAILAPLGRTPRTFSADDIIDRLMIPMVNEVVRCYEEGIINSPAEADLALVYGLGFPPFRGGIFRYLDDTGTRAFCEKADRFSALGPLYSAPDSLRAHAASNTSYYPQPGSNPIEKQ